MGSHGAANVDRVTVLLLGVEYGRYGVTDRGIEATGRVAYWQLASTWTVKFAAELVGTEPHRGKQE